MKERNKQFLFLIFLTAFLCFFPVNDPVKGLVADYSQEIEDIQKEIEEQQKSIANLEKQKNIYEEKIGIKRQEAISLKNQISILTDQMSKREVEIQEKETEIFAANLSVKKIQLKILEKKQEITDSKDNLKQLLVIINQYDQKSPLEIVFLNASISEVFNHMRYLSTLQEEVAKSLARMELIQEGLEIQEKDLRVQLQNLIDLKSDLNEKKNKLEADKQAKEMILEETRGAEWKFQSLLAETITEQKKMEEEIASLEKEVREKIAKEKEKQAEFLEKEGTIVFSWPVPVEGITCSFHDQDYPYRSWIGEHSGIDLRAAQGTAIRVAASGYVARAKNGGLDYSYIMIIHNDSFSTLYGHVSEILVQEGEYIKRGTVIGRSGGLPGTSGAGKFSTGPHLHFEVRLNGLPVNPEDYLL